MNADDYYGMTAADIVAADTVLELTSQRQALCAVAARALLHDVPGDPDRLDECVSAGADQPVDRYGNPLSGDRIINCCFPDCGCDGARLCQAERGPNFCSRSCNIERSSR